MFNILVNLVYTPKPDFNESLYVGIVRNLPDGIFFL